jgi:hypothetical protein
MNSNQRSEINNQTENGANKKGMPGSKGNTTDGPLDHTYPQGAAQQQGVQKAGTTGTQQSGAGPGIDAAGGGRDSGGRTHLPGGSMQTQQTGGTGPVQGVTDSHQKAMEQRSGAYGQLEQPVGDRSRDQASPAGTRGGGQHGPQSSVESVQGGSMGARQSATPSGTQGGGQLGGQIGSSSVQQGGPASGQQSMDRAGTQTGSRQENEDPALQSNDLAGGLPRSPGNSGPSSGPRDTHLTGAQIHANQQKAEGGVHNSNDAAGGYPKSPGGSNKLAADEKMDDDTGFSNKG